jgi:hypothetical protein
VAHRRPAGSVEYLAMRRASQDLLRDESSLNRVAVLWAILPAGGCIGISHRAPAESRAVLQIYRLNDAERKYKNRFGSYGSLDQLGPFGVGLITAELSEGVVAGYRFEIAVNKTGYVVRASPTLEGRRPGRYSFYSDETAIIRWALAWNMSSPKSSPV